MARDKLQGRNPSRLVRVHVIVDWQFAQAARILNYSSANGRTAIFTFAQLFSIYLRALRSLLQFPIPNFL
jgi:hypothetical protein